MMNEPNQVINAQALAIVPANRKRGRPRKYPALDDPSSFLGSQSPTNGTENFHVPPTYRGSNGHKSRRVNRGSGLRDGMTGQAVSGFLEAEFDGGYLLTVRLRNSNTLLRGVVFKPEQFIPVSADNDVAPNVHMVKRQDKPAPFSSGNYGHAHGGSRRRSRDVNGFAYPSSSPSSVPLKNKIILPSPLRTVGSVTSIVPSRGNVVPVVLQPVTPTNNGTFPRNEHGHNLSTPVSKESQPVALQVVHPVVQSSPSAKQAPQASPNGPRDEPRKEASDEVDIKPVILPPPGMSFENSVAEVIKRTQTPPKADNNAGNGQTVGNLSYASGDGIGLQEQSPVVPFTPMNLSHSVREPLEGERTGKMTELLQAVQENAMKNQMNEPR